jgi:hypothetical protein
MTGLVDTAQDRRTAANFQKNCGRPEAAAVFLLSKAMAYLRAIT